MRLPQFTILLCLVSVFSSAQEPVQVEALEIVAQRLVEEVPLLGSVATQRRSQLSSQVEGYILALPVDVGDTVEAGEVLLRLDEEVRRHEYLRLLAEVRRAELAWQDGRRRYEEGSKLSVEAMAQSEVRTLEAQQAMMEAQWQTAKAESERLAALLERHEVRAPFSGTITAKLSEEGQWLAPGEPVLELVDMTRLFIDFQVPQRYFSRITERTEVQVTIDDQNGAMFPAQVYRKVPLSIPGARTFLLRTTGSSEQRLIPGMAASGRLQVELSTEGIVLPRDALIRHPDGRTTVWVLEDAAWGEETRVREQRVTTGSSVAGQVEILEGLVAGDVVVLRGNEALRQGQRVRVAPRGDSDV